MDQDLDVGISLAELVHVLGPKHLVHAAVALPQNNLGATDRVFGVVTAGRVGEEQELLGIEVVEDHDDGRRWI